MVAGYEDRDASAGMRMTTRHGAAHRSDGDSIRRARPPETLGPGRRTVAPRPWALAILVFAAACSDATVTAPVPTDAPIIFEDEPAEGSAREWGLRRDRYDPLFSMVDELVPWDTRRWKAEWHAFGRGKVDTSNVRQSENGLRLVLPKGTYDGGEIISNRRFGFRTAAARMKTPRATGSISAFFFYEGVRGGNDEIDIEIFNNGSRQIWFTTWVGGTQTNHVQRVLPFDPSLEFHDYTIEWSSDRIAFYVDGEPFEEMSEGIPQNQMYLMANAWWPSWMKGAPAPPNPGLEIDRISY